jgi:molecular chaperone HtpG
MSKETLNFGADVSRLLEIVAHALYSNKDVFLRELISNAADACDRLRYETIKNPKLIKNNSEFKIRVVKDSDKRTLFIKDNGIGMNKEDLIENLGTIAKSGTASLMEQINNAGNEKDKLNLIGQFGVGFYASFMIADNVEVVSTKAGEDSVWHWESDGKTGFTVREAKKEETDLLEDKRGTTIILKINDEASDFLLEEKLKQIIQTYSDHIDFSIFLGEAKEAESPINEGSSLWMKPKSEIKEEQYTEFYKHITHGFDDPLMTSHWKAEGLIEYSALLYLPTLRPWDLYDPSRKHSVRLYVKRVFITDDCEGLMYPWLRFVRGVIDSEDLPLNISREMLQDNPVVNKIKNGVTKKILKDLDKLSKDKSEEFKAFWGQFGPVIKEGLYDSHEHRDEIFNVCRFYSTDTSDTVTSLSDYISRMKPGQESIYYISGENADTLRNSPQLEGFKDKGIEVLLFTDTIDDFWLQMVDSYKDKTFKSVTRGDIDLSDISSDKEKKSKKKETDKKTEEVSKELEPFINAVKSILNEEIEDVRISNRLTDSPVCIVASESGMDMNIERVLKIHQKYEGEQKRILEINATHPLIKQLAGLALENKNKETLESSAFLLLDQARIIQGEPIPNPTRFAKSMSKFMELGLAA